MATGTSVIDQIHDITESVFQTTSSGESQEPIVINEVTLDDLKKKRNKQLIISLVVITIIIGGIIVYKKMKKK